MGNFGSSTAAEQTDYVRACNVVDYVGIIDCGASHVIILGDEPLQSKFIKIKAM